MSDNKSVSVETSGIAVSIDAGMLRTSISWSPSQFGIDNGQIPDQATTGGSKLWVNSLPYRFRQFRDNANNLVSRMSYKVGKLNFVPDSVALKCLTELQTIEDEYYAHKRHVIDNLDHISSEWMEAHPELHLDIKNYPTASHLENSLRFVVDYHLISFPDEVAFERMKMSAAKDILEENEDQLAKIRVEMRSKASAFMANCTGQLLEEALKVTGKLHSQLQGKGKLNGGSVKAFNSFFERFRLLNISGDSSLDGLLESIQRELIAHGGITQADASMDTEKKLAKALDQVMSLGTKAISDEAGDIFEGISDKTVVELSSDETDVNQLDEPSNNRFMGGSSATSRFMGGLA